ncbi:tachykinin family protein [Akanthomyces lecanii RCEF 1005]|uniref:Tachykinin family protein n=1 Tax=Akanthomyces lecanii RCEF 1005 TaxID=1081108 RepID=A0A162IV25_CORDF|nr:tachykinin family protein [Akanthomyces lecanii RCEF 1005]
MEAIRIIMGWIGDHNMALSDVTFAAVLRLSTYERYWGTELDWQIHHDGLLRMINARGGLGTFAHNWRLALIAFLNTLVVRPSWLDSSNRIWELAMPQSLYALRLIVGEESSMHQIRCLWLLSLGQDIEHFALISIESCRNGLASCANLQDALMLLMLKMKQYDLTSRRDAKIGDFEFRRLACVLFIAILCQGCTTAPADASALSQGSGWVSCPLALILLDVHLLEYRDTWLSDVDGLYVTLYSGFFGVDDGIPNRDYVLTMASVLGSMSSTTRQRIESSLLHILCSGAAA